MNRKKKLRIAQISLLVLGSLILIFTYSERTVSKKEKIIPEITQEKIGASAVILAPGDSKDPTFEGLEIVSATSKCDFRLFGKPTARPYRRMGVVVTYDYVDSLVSEVTKKARKLADKIEVKL